MTEKYDPDDRLSGYSKASSASAPPLRDHVVDLQRQLQTRYPPLGTASPKPIGATGGLRISRKDVLITQYPSFANGDDRGPVDRIGWPDSASRRGRSST